MASLFAISYIPRNESCREKNYNAFVERLVVTIVGFFRGWISQAFKVDVTLIVFWPKFQGACTFTGAHWSRACKQIALISRPVSHFWEWIPARVRSTLVLLPMLDSLRSARFWLKWMSVILRILPRLVWTRKLTTNNPLLWFKSPVIRAFLWIIRCQTGHKF